MAISHIDTIQASVVDSGSISMDAPGNLLDRDVLYAIIARSESEGGSWITVPNGWTELLAELSVGGTPITIPALSIWRRYVRTVADQGATYLWECDDALISCGYVVGLRGVAIRADEQTVVTVEQESGVPHTPVLWDVLPDAWLLSAALKDDGDAILAVPTSYTQRGSIISQDVIGGQSLAIGTRSVSSSGDQQQESFSAPSAPWCSATVILLPETESE